MNFPEYSQKSIRQWNQQIITQNDEYKKEIDRMYDIEKFMSEFSFLSSGRDFVICGEHIFSLQKISTATELTVGSIISCCEAGCMADAYSLLRKYRDDLFFYLYIIVYDSYKKVDNKLSTVDTMESNIELWINDDLRNLHIGTVLKAIGQFSSVKGAVKKYGLKSYFDALGDRLNNYVHSNGVSFYNQSASAYQEKTLQGMLQELLRDMRYIAITFLFLLILCSPLSIMSTDYMDYLDCNETPPIGSQYWVAPFITEFIKNNIDLIDEGCMKYLRDNTLMEF